MGFYNKHVLPKLIHLACSGRPTRRQRAKVVPLARGRVLEVGVGSGLNLPFYDKGRIDRLWALDPSLEMLAMAELPAHAAGFPVELMHCRAEKIELETGSVDTVVVTYTLCSIPQPEAALRQMARVLKPDGQLIFCEHGLAPDENVRRWQNRLNGTWGRLGGGCNLNRDIPAVIGSGGFKIVRMETMYLPGWKPGTFNYWGVAEVV